MAKFIELSDFTDSRLDDFRDLAKSDRRPDRPGGRGWIIAEGMVVVQRLLESGYPVRAILGLPHRLAKLVENHGQLPVSPYAVTESVLADVVGFPFHRGVMAIAERPTKTLSGNPFDRILRHARTVLVLERIGDPENLGAIFRNASALGVAAVVLGPGCADPFYRRCVRVSMGQVLRIPFVTVNDVPMQLKKLEEQGFHLLALTPAHDSVALHSINFSPSEKVALILGSEGEGLTVEALTAAHARVSIPMANQVDSVNVATAAAIALYQLGRV